MINPSRNIYKILTFFVIFLWSIGNVFAKDSSLQVLSPVEGVWANKQALILDVPEGVEVYYSFTGSDPLDFGFAYDGPVVLNATGSVPLRLAAVYQDGSVQQIKISFTVNQPESAWQLPFDENRPFFNYSPGDVIPIPENFYYCLGDKKIPDLVGRPLYLEGAYFPARYLPCTVTDGVFSWRFVISTETPRETAFDSGLDNFYISPEEEPPFIVSDWNYLTFTKKNLIYTVDDNFWELADGSIYIDRDVPHTISWQSVAYEVGNPIYSITLPAKPTLELSYDGNQAAILEAPESYKIAIQGEQMNPVDTLKIDAFFGEEYRGDFLVDLYFENLYQGTTNFSVNIDKMPPAKPEILSSSNLFYNRDKVTVDFSVVPDSHILYNVSILASKPDGFNEMEVDLHDEKKLSLSDFVTYHGEPIQLSQEKTSATLYHLVAYSTDEYGNISAPSDYKVIIDPYNFYISTKNVASLEADGSLVRPFSSFTQALEVVKERDFTRLHLDGMCNIDSDIVITSKCEINGEGNSSGLKLKEGNSIIVKNGGQVSINNCILQLEETSLESLQSSSFFKINSATLNFSGCEIVASFNRSGSIFSADSSTIVLDDCGATIHAKQYASLISGIKTNATVTKGRYTVTATTAVAFSLSGGLFSLMDSECRIFSTLGRVAELSGVAATIENNTFFAELNGDSSAIARVAPVWYDGHSKLKSYNNNEISGFPGGI